MANILLHACATGAALLLALAAVLWLHERGAFDAMARFLPHSACERILLAVVAVGFIHYGATKETNGVRGVSAPMRSAPSAPRVLTQGEIDAGYALVGVGTDETFDFSPPPGAAVAERWRRRGAAHDKLQIAPEGWFFPSGDVTVTNLTVRSEGRARLPNGIEVAPLPAVHGIVPEMNWPRLAESDRPSLFWHALSGDGSLVLTWQNVLLHRAVTNPVSFQAELKPSGSVTFRYDISRLGSDDVLAGVAPFLGNAAAAPLSRDVTSITFGHRKESVCDESRSEFEAKFGGLDPFAFPEGSTNTFFEHVFYSGTTNGAFSFPHDTNDTAVLRVAVSGTGSGDLLVGDAYVPLLTPPMRGTKGGTRTSGGPARPEVLVPGPRGRTLPLYLRADGTLSVSFDSQSFAFGELPDAAAHRFAGWVNFPDTRATEPCIHDFSRNSKGVTLPASGGADGLACTWRGGDGVEVENVPPRSATLTATFDPGGTGLITYTLSHPAYLFGAAEYSQTVRHCPSVDESEPPFDRDPWIDGDDYDSCRCHGDCPDDPPESSEDEFDGYDDASTNAVEFLARVLYMRDPPETGDTAWLEVPTGYVACCQCPDHWTNHVGVAYKSGRLEVRDASGREFWSSAESCAVGVAGIHPSEAVGDAELAFESNGELIMRRGYTVLGVGIRREGVPLSRYNDLSDTFGFPMTVCTNVWDAPEMRLVTNVGLPFGRVRIELEDAAGRFAVWRRNGGGWLRLAGGGEPAADIPIATWRAMIDGSGDNGELPVRITASAPGPARLVFRYWAVIDGAFVEDAAAQRITAVDPLLLADYNRDGVLDDIDIARYMAGRYAYFWRNDDRWKDDNAFDLPLFNDVNSSDNVVNGRNDLINFLPIAVDVSPFESHWSSGSVYYRLEAYSPALRNAKLAFAEIDRSQIGDAPLGNDGDIYGNSLHEAPVFALGGGTNLPPAFASLSQSGRSPCCR